MYQKKIKQLTAAVLCAAMVMSQAPTSYAVSDDDMMFVVVEDSEFEVSEDTESFEETSETDDLIVEEEDASSEEVTEETSEDEEVISPDEVLISDEASEDSSSEDEVKEVTELPEGVVGMPEGYELTTEEKEIKAELLENPDAYEEFIELTEGEDYVADQVICLADSEEHAKEIAAAYSGELADFEYGVATIDLSNSEIDVATAYTLAFDENVDLPVVSPNYYRYLIGPVDTDKISDTSIDAIGDTSPVDEDEEIDVEDSEAEFEAKTTWKDVYGKSVNGITFNDQFLNPKDHYYQWHHDMVKTYSAWKITTGAEHTVTVAVIDTGVQASHPELSGKVTNRSGDPGDGDGHGTHVAGIIAAKAGNGVGGAGIAPNAKILSVQVFDGNGKVTSDDAVLKAIQYVGGTSASTRKADIMNLSLGGPAYDPAEQRVVTNATNNGVTVIAAMGNELSNHKSYPAAYKNVIAVGAVSENGKKTYFSNYGSWKDISAPGADITSTYPTGKKASRCTVTGYQVMDGTSQATPVVAGACALYMGYVGHVSPAAMEKAVKKATSNGILNVEKLIKSAKPQAVSTNKKNVTAVKIKNTSGNNAAYKAKEKNGALSSATIYVGGSVSSISLEAVQATKSGSAPTPVWTSSNPAVASVVGSGNKATVKAVSKGSVTITSTATDGSGKKASVTIKVAQCVTEVQLSGQTNNVLPGSKVSYKATVYPKNANYKTISYSLGSSYKGVTIDAKTGKVTVANNASGKFKVVATAIDDPGKKSSSIEVTIGSKAKATGVNFTTMPKTTIATAAPNGNFVTSTTVAAKASNGADIVWKSSDDGVVKVSSKVTASGTAVTLTAVKSGKATITATANDGSKKKASIKINVINPVSSLHLVVGGGNSDYVVASGCSTSLKAVLGSTYGKASNKKVTYTYEIYGRGSKGLEPLTAKAQKYCKDNKAFFSVNQKGKLSCNSYKEFKNHVTKIKNYGASYSSYAVKVRATAQDGSGCYDEKTFVMVPKNQALYFYVGNYEFYQAYRARKGSAFGVNVYGNYYELAVTSSNPNVACAYLLETSSGPIIRVDCNGVGTAKITVKTVDGSKVSGSFTVNVY